ncbi:DUF4244 domain-containing protein [Frigoribacterium sp. VKM Ac-2836]|uniref:DUF4244 domain-containing protein n=1 Tax=Frigoribacterium sp. VKM Ac-2836 TaxID=2739014 RepID=UPI0015648920|nr:DUF4244 domain-containing protein [Frigoribacterium sp. VKM Ac-2836]NRD25351.1 DUF4244 domain-containing protein [Frigoribacterium sp. VKM Ac-2836]
MTVALTPPPVVPTTGPRSSRSSSAGRLASVARRLARADDGAATAEYAIVIMAAVGFAGLLVTIMRSDEVRGVLSDLVRSALTVG